MIKLLIFDYDGVIFDTADIAYNLVKKECNKYCKAPIKTRQDFMDVYKINFYESMKKRGVKKEDMKKIIKESLEILSKKKLRIHPGMKSAVKKLSQTHSLAVVSSNYDIVMKKNLKKHGILECFDFILGTEAGKSKQQKVKSLLKNEKLSFPEAVFITDTVGDIKEAKKAKVKAMAVTWGFHTKQMLKNAKPDFIVQKPSQMTEVLV